ncbi:SDR family NAD(P)-dependent oxidoreductase [Nocardioides sp. LHD-245]|uniref:SDR family NAD(P)-dependent oxidoreductase n=1 Tax=Nocardioides sp. LHD-245 TaxID=3051387 RepID=UPI0027E190E8|nr:SDR family NAD(P)-dependent oxidoreductase [Nocardioides sp. LHD-245]
MTTDASSAPAPVAIVAGGARGIGRAVALRLAERGARVAVLDIDLAAAAAYGEELTAPSVAEELVARAGEGWALQVDLTDPGAAAEAVGTVVERWGRLDALVVTAGGAVTPYDRSRASVTTDEDLTTLLDVNVRAVVNCCRAAVPHLRATGGGAIVTTGSSAGLESAPDGSVAGYGMSKAAVQHYTRSLAREVGQWGIRVNCIAPGVIRTSRVLAQSRATGFVDDAAAAAIPLRRQGEPEDIADVAEFLTGPLSSYVSGQVIAVSGGAVTP